jgi:hypothetical protein
MVICLPHNPLPNVNKLEAVDDLKNWKLGFGGRGCVSLHKMNSMISGTKSRVEQSNTSNKFWASVLADHFDAPEYQALIRMNHSGDTKQKQAGIDGNRRVLHYWVK